MDQRKTHSARAAQSRRVTHSPKFAKVVTFTDTAETLLIDLAGALSIQRGQSKRAVDLFESGEWFERNSIVAGFQVHRDGWGLWWTKLLIALADNQTCAVPRFARACAVRGLKPRWMPTDPASGPGVAEDVRGGRLMQFADGFHPITREEENHWLKACRQHPHEGGVVKFC